MKETFKNIFRFFDYFGDSFTFKYKNEDKLSTVLGGVTCLILSIGALVFFIYNFIPFANKENFSLQYYTRNLNKTEEIFLGVSPTAFAAGLKVDNNNNSLPYDIYDLLEVKFYFKNVTKKFIPPHKCNTSDFYDLYNEMFEKLNISNYKCLSSEDLISPKGIYTDDEFYYYIISVESKDKDNETHNQLINDYLTMNDCKLQFFYTDITIDVTNFTHPNSSFLNSMFIQLNPTLIQKKNVFFMNYHLFDDNQILHIKRQEDNEKDEIVKTGLSRVEDYALYKGLDRVNNKPDDYEAYAKMYIRVDNKRIEIKRRYQDLMEFYADTSSLLITIFWLFGIFFAYYDKIKANFSISKKLFFVEGFANKNNFDKFKDLIKKINESKSLRILFNPNNENPQNNKSNPPRNDKNLENGAPATNSTDSFTTKEMKERLGVKDSRPLADFLPTLTIAAKNLATEMTNYNVEEKDLQGESAITVEHVDNNSSVREMLGQRGIKPENLPPSEDIRKLERRV